MKKYLIASLFCLMSFSAVAQMGENSQSTANLCNSPQVTSCEPCLKACVNQHKAERAGANDKGNTKTQVKGGTNPSGTSKQ